MARDLTLSIDVGTGSVRAALVDSAGAILHIAAREHDQIVPQFGWAEQRPLDWWTGVAASIRDALGAVEGARERIAAVCACGQMHGTVLVDEAGRLTRDTAPLVERQADRRDRRGFRTRARCVRLSRRERQSADAGMARLQAACGCATTIPPPIAPPAPC